MRVFFDTSAIVPALVDQLSNHEAALLALGEYTRRPNEAVCSTHCLAECYAVITSLPLARRVTPAEAEQLINESIADRLTVWGLSEAAYREAVALVAQRGFMSGAVYDALHVVAAVESRSERIITYNVRNFRGLALDRIAVVTP